MRLECQNCKQWDKYKRKWKYHLPEITGWRPPHGFDPKIREFQCPFCRHKTYVILTLKTLYKLGEEKYAYAYSGIS